MTVCFTRGLWQVVLALVLVVLPTVLLQAAPMPIKADVTRTMTSSDERFGGCAVALSESPFDHGLDCHTDKWVTFSCVGEHTSKSNALRMFDSAQMAFALGKKVVVYVDDTRKHNDRCFASRIDVLPDDVSAESTAPTDLTE